MTDDKMFPIWDEKYSKLGVTPRELYMRQNGLCWLAPEVSEEGTTLYCTDGKDKAVTALMLNPTYECMRCVSRFTEKVISDAVQTNKQEHGEGTGGDNS